MKLDMGNEYYENNKTKKYSVTNIIVFVPTKRRVGQLRYIVLTYCAVWLQSCAEW